MPWYSTENVEDITILRLKGDASTRHYQWLGGLDGLLMRGHRRLVISLEEVVIPNLSDAAFLAVMTRRTKDLGGDAVYVVPRDAHAQRILRQARSSKVFPFAPTVAAGREHFTLRPHPDTRVDNK